ncbi:MAG: cysteine desulfurase family protein [Planctomycetota bacterium]
MIYLDNHATTRCDPRVVDRMVPWLSEAFGNPHSSAHEMGREAGAAVDAALDLIANKLGLAEPSILLTSGATESNNLAIDGICRHPRQKRRHIVTTTIEHPAVLDVVARLEKDGFTVTRVDVHPNDHPQAGQVDLDRLAEAIHQDTALVSVHWANNEIGVVQPMQEIAAIAHRHDALFHSDATQAVGRIPVDLGKVDVDLISASAHKFYGPKGAGFLTIGGGLERRRIRMKPLFLGGGQQNNLRGGTVAPANAVAVAAALEYAVDELTETAERVIGLRSRLWGELEERIGGLRLNGSPLAGPQRLPGNLNLILPGIEGAAWIAATPDVAFSSGSACSSVDAKPSHVLTGLGLTEGEARRSVRFGIGKFNDADDIESAIESLTRGYEQVRGELNSRA